MKLVIDGNAAAGTIEMGGFDYHSGNRMDGEARDLNLGNCIGACLEYAARVGKPVMIYVFSDGSLASNGMIDSSVGGRGKGVWTADNQSVAATYFLVYNPAGKPVPAQSNPEMSLQIGSFNPDGSHQHHRQPGGQQRAQPGADGGAQLHGAAWRRPQRLHLSDGTVCRVSQSVSGAQLEQHAGYGHCARALDRLPPDRGRKSRVDEKRCRPRGRLRSCALSQSGDNTLGVASLVNCAPSAPDRCATSRQIFHECAPSHTEIQRGRRLLR